MAEDFAIGRALVIPQSVMNNLKKIDEKINLIASDSEKMATHFTSAMTRMGNGAGDLIQKLQSIQGLVGSIGNINIKGIDNASTSMSKTATEAEKVANNVTQAATAINKMGSGMNIAELTAKIKELNDQLTKGGGVQTVAEQQSIVNQKRALEEELKLQKQSDNEKQKIRERSLEQELKRSDRELSAIKKLEDERIKSAQREYQAQAKIDSQLRKLNYQSYVTSTEGSLRTADKANTYAQRAQAIKNLEEAIKRLRTTDANYQKDLQRLSDAHKRLSNEQKKVEANYKSIQTSQRRLMDTSGQLARQLALIFSVSQIEGYIMKLVRVRGEFELQNTALASILQNKDQADKLFGQITELAVKSPFTVKELTTYTKSLAAYQVQYEDLYDTTKMLADVSAGLGVDMQRLILAFGQVKAANFLRGTETRQFTEAGINMLGELAKYYTELEGRIVSVSEVQDRQFKKMISFQDVEQVFKRLTSAGGMFYEMQERQAETIAGQMSNLQDTIDIMLNDIGKANDGTIRLMISTIKSIIENWEIFANAIKTAGVAFTLYYAKVMLASVANGAFTKSTIAATVAQGGLAGATGKAITAIRALTTAIKSNPFLAIASAVTLLGFELNDHVKKVEENKKAYDVFTNSIKRTGTEFNDIVQRINEQNQKVKESSDTLSSVEKGTNEYVEAESNANKQREKMSALLEELNTKFPEVYESIVKQKDGTVDLTEAQRLLNEELEKTTYLSYLSKQTETFWNDGLVENIKDASDAQQQYKITSEDLSNAYLQMNSRIKEYFATNKYASKDLQKQLEDIANSSLSTSEKIEKMYSVVRNVSGVNIGDLRGIIYDYQDEAREVRNANKELEDSNSALSESIKQVANGYKLAFDTTSEEGRKSAKAATEEFIRLLDIKNEAVREFVRSQFEITIGVKLNIDNKATPELSDMEKRINNYLDNMNFTLVPKIDAGEGTVKFFNELKEEYKSLTAEAEKIKRASQELYPDQTNAQRLEEINNKMVQVKTTLKDWGELEEKKNKTTKDNSAIKRLNEQIALIKKAGDEYEKLRKYYSDDEAAAKVRESFADAFNNLGLDITMDFDTTGVINGIENISHKAGQAGKKAIDNAVASLKTEQEINVKVKGIEEIQKEIDSIFTNYEFSLELKTAGIDADAFKNMLKSVGATDEEISLAGLDVTTFEQAQKKIRDIINDLQKQGGKEQLDLAKKYQEQLTQLEVKEARKRFDELLTLREKYQTNEEKIAKIEGDISSWEKELDDIKQLGDAANKEQQELLEMRIQNGNDAILKLKSEALQLTEFWRTLFGDLEDLSVNSLRKLSDTVDEVIGSSKEIKGDKGQLVGYSAEYTDKDGLKKQVTLTVEQYQRLLKQNNQVADEIQEKNPFIALFDAIVDGKKEGETKLDYIVRLEGILGDVSNAAFQVASDLAEIFGADEEAKELISNIKGVADGAISLGTGIARIASGDILGGAMSAISGISSIVSSINSIHDNKREREIERQTELVEDLERAYDKLYDTIENGLSISMYSQNSALIKNLTAQIESYQAMIEAERDKKNTDYGRINEWENQIDDIYSQIDELYQNLKTNLVGDFKSVSQQLGDAIAEAFANGTDAAEAWGDSVKEIVADMVKNLLVQKLIEPGVQQILDQAFESAMPNTSAASDIKEQIDDLYEQYNSLKPDSGSLNSMRDYKKRKEELENQIRQLEEQYQQAVAAKEGEVPNLTQDIINNTIGQLESLSEDVLSNPAWDIYKELLGPSSGDTMTGLSKSISSITEDTAEVLASITESIRYFTSDSNTVLHNIYNLMINPPVENPFLAEMKVQSTYLSNLNALVSSVIKNSSGKGKVLRVEIA